MKNKEKELNVDFIGRQDKPLTKEEELSISVFIKKLKERRNKKTIRKTAKQVKQPA
mgnify:CR=1 FL=1